MVNYGAGAWRAMKEPPEKPVMFDATAICGGLGEAKSDVKWNV
jgi:hypothetical protein